VQQNVNSINSIKNLSQSVIEHHIATN